MKKHNSLGRKSGFVKIKKIESNNLLNDLNNITLSHQTDYLFKLVNYSLVRKNTQNQILLNLKKADKMHILVFVQEQYSDQWLFASFLIHSYLFLLDGSAISVLHRETSQFQPCL